MKSGKKHNADKDITNRITKLLDVRNPESDGAKQLIKMATETYDAYFDLDVAQKYSIYHEQAYLVDRNLNTLLKHYDLEKPECAQCLHQLIEFKFDVYKAAGGYIPVILSELD